MRLPQSNFYDSEDHDSSRAHTRLPSHQSFFSVYEQLQKLQSRFPIFQDDALFSGQNLLYALASKKYLDHRSASHLSRLVLSIHLMHKEMQQAFVSSPQARRISVKWIPTRLSFPFSTHHVMGCLIGVNLMDCYEVFDEANVQLVLEKNHPEISIVKDSCYRHVLPNPNLRIIYFEIEKKDASLFTLTERHLLRAGIEQHIRGGFQKLAPTIFMRRNEEEAHKTILTLSREIHSVNDLPQAWISFEQQTKEEAVFLVILVYVLSKKTIPLRQSFSGVAESTFVAERHITVRHLAGRPVEACVFRVHLSRSLSLIRSDGSLDFYASRRKVVDSVSTVIGEFRDFNGGTLIKQRELLDSFKDNFPKMSLADAELMETFFYAITPLEKQALLKCESLLTLYRHFLTHRYKKLDNEVPYFLDIIRTENEVFLAIKMVGSLKQLLLTILEKSEVSSQELTYTIVETPEGLFFHSVCSRIQVVEELAILFRQMVSDHRQSIKKHQILRVGMEHPPLSLDPRVGGDQSSSCVLQMLFEGLTRIDKNGKMANGVAETIEISSDFRRYTFKLRSSYWNDGSSVTAYDFEYAWKKVLSPSFKTPFADLFYPIRFAKEAKEGTVPLNQVGITALDQGTLQVDLVNPTPYFLELTAQPLLYPVQHAIDQKCPQWPYQAGKYYPCNGPFQIAVNDPVHHTYRLAKNPYYWDCTSVALDEILLVKTNPYQALEAFHKNELDWIGSPFGSWHAAYANSGDKREVTIPDTSVCWLVLNTKCPPFNHDKIRQAFAYVIDRQQLIANALLTLTPAYSVLLPRQSNHCGASFARHNIERAQQLFQEGLEDHGWTRERMPPLRLTFVQGGIRDGIAMRLQEQLCNFLGIDCHLQPLHWNTLFPKLTQGEFEMSLMSWVPRTEDPTTILNVFRDGNNEINFSNWESPRLQYWLNLCEREVNIAKRSYYQADAEKELSRAAPVIPLFYHPSQALTRPDLNVPYNHSFDLVRSFFQRE